MAETKEESAGRLLPDRGGLAGREVNQFEIVTVGGVTFNTGATQEVLDDLSTGIGRPPGGVL